MITSYDRYHFSPPSWVLPTPTVPMENDGEFLGPFVNLKYNFFSPLWNHLEDHPIQ